jgi:hypothetical protein
MTQQLTYLPSLDDKIQNILISALLEFPSSVHANGRQQRCSAVQVLHLAPPTEQQVLEHQRRKLNIVFIH